MDEERRGGQVLYSVRMRAAQGGPHERGGRHVSGAERIVTEERLHRTVRALLERARRHARGDPDFVQVTVERVPAGAVARIAALPVVTLGTGAPDEARRVARALLEAAGVAPVAAREAVALLAAGPGPAGTAMRGAVLMDAATGERLEPDRGRGVRVTRVDYDPAARRRLEAALRRRGLRGEAVRRAREALALASKAAWVGALAELGWSDDPGYTTGYVAAPAIGYVRLPGIKEAGDCRGGRVLFLAAGETVRVDGGLAGLIGRLEEAPVLIAAVGRVGPAVPPEEFLEGLRVGDA